MTEANNFLDFCFNNKRINETDKQEILLLHAKLQTYNYNDVFSPDVICEFRKSCIACSNRTILDNNGGHYYLRGTAIHKNKNRIFKVWITNKENPCTNDVCFQMLIEYYFHNIFFNSITDNILTVPQTYNYGKVILDANNEILYFYEMEYYDSVKYVLDSINNLDNESKWLKLCYFHANLKLGHNTLHNMESRISAYHLDNHYDSTIDHSQDMLFRKIATTNMFVYNDKCILIDFGAASRLQEISGTLDQLDAYVTNNISRKNT
jgi:hypothetical protein